MTDEAKMFLSTRVDGRGIVLCCNCWNGAHYYRYGDGGIKVISDKPSHYSNCLGNDCECPCVELVNDKPKRVTKAQRKAYADEHQLRMPRG